MTQHLIDTDIKLAQCNRCSSYVWACHTGGSRVMADPKPLADVDEYLTALGDVRGCYVVSALAGRPHRLSAVAGTTPIAQRLAEGRVVASHACGTRAMNHTRVDATEVVPPKASASTAAATATAARPRSELLLSCSACGEFIDAGPGREPYWGIEGLPEGDYFEHLECP